MDNDVEVAEIVFVRYGADARDTGRRGSVRYVWYDAE